MKINLEALPLKELRHFERLQDDTPTSILREAEILRPGTYKGHNFTADDVISLVEMFDARSPVPLQLEHNMSLEKDHGRVLGAKLIYEGIVPVALGLVNVLGQWAVERVLDNRFHALSPGVFLDPCRMDELSFVRRGACPTARLLSEETIMDDMTDEEMKKIEDEAMAAVAAAVADEDAPVAEVPEEATEAEEAPTPEEDEEEEAVQMSAEVSEVEQLKIELESVRAAQAETARKLELSECQQQAERLMSEGFTTPALQPQVEKLLLEMSEANREEFLALMRSQERLWEPGRQSAVQLSHPAQDKKEQQFENMKKAAGLT